MSDEVNDIERELNEFASKRGPATLLQAVVKSVNETEATIDVELEAGGALPDVQLRSVVDSGKAVVKIPKQGTTVLIACINKSEEYYMIDCAEVEKIIVEIGTLKLTVTNKIKIENGTDNLKTALDKIVDATAQIVVLQGNNPNYVKLAEAKVSINNMLE